MTRSGLTRELVLGALLVAGSVSGVDAAQPPANQGVTVNNTPDNPVPVTGSVDVTGTPSVRDADNPAFQPFAEQVEMTIPDGGGINSKLITTVPPGKRLVIENVSATAFMPTGQTPIIKLTVCNPCITFSIPVTAQATATLDHFVANQAVRYYAGPGALVGVTFERIESETSEAFLLSSFSGHLVDLPD